MMIDAHCHFFDFAEHNPNDLSRNYSSYWDFFAKVKDLTFNFSATQPKDWELFEYLLDKKPEVNNIFCFFGLHPWKLGNAELNLGKAILDLEEELKKYKNVGIGEIGLDLATEIDLKIQEKAFFEQMSLAVKYQRPVSIHCVRAYDLLFKSFKKIKQGFRNQDLVFMVHSFNGSTEILKELINYGGYVSFGAKFWNSRKFEKLILNTPNNRILVESDFVFEVGNFENKYEEYFVNLENLYSKIAEIKNTKVDEFKALVRGNFGDFVRQIKN